MKSFTFAVPVHNEHTELKKLLLFLFEKKNKCDEILVLECSNKVTPKVKEVLKQFDSNIRVISYPLEKSFIYWKGKIHERLKGYRRKHKLPITNDDFCLYHIKNIKRLKKQYKFYNEYFGQKLKI